MFSKGNWCLTGKGMISDAPLQEDPPSSESREVSGLFSFIPQGVHKDLQVSVPNCVPDLKDRTHSEGRAPEVLAQQCEHPCIPGRWAAVGSGPGPGTGGCSFRAQVTPADRTSGLAHHFPPETKLNHCIKYSFTCCFSRVFRKVEGTAVFYVNCYTCCPVAVVVEGYELLCNIKSDYRHSDLF